MELNIGPYKILQRTKYSKLQVFDESNNNISNTVIGIKILSDYCKQIGDPYRYFEIKDNSLVNFMDKENNIEFVFVPYGIKNIEKSAFENGKFTQIHLPDSVQTIKAFAFSNCIFLRDIKLPDNISNIGYDAFCGCAHLMNVKLPLSLEKIDEETFMNCRSLKYIIIPDTIKQISHAVFNDCINLEYIKLSNNLESLGNKVFENCFELSKIDLPSSLKSIGGYCFAKCKKLKEITIPNNISILHSGMFFECSELATIKLPDQLSLLPYDIFAGCKNLENIELPDTINTLGTCVFSNTYKLNNIDIPKELECIDSDPLAYSGIKSITFKHDLEKLITNTHDLITTSEIDKIIISNTVKTITPDAFKYSGSQITSIDYLGSEEEFDKFKDNNERLFKECLINVRDIKFLEKTINDLIKEEDMAR